MSKNCAGKRSFTLAETGMTGCAELKTSVSLRIERAILGCHPKRAVFRALSIAAIACFITRSVLLPIEVDGNSMEPTYNSGQASLTNRLAYHFKAPKRGHIVSVKTTEEGVRLLKRVIGLPGDKVEMVNGVVLINGRPLSEPYANTQGGWTMPAIVLENDEYWVIGDNRRASEFSRVHLDDIVGQVMI